MPCRPIQMALLAGSALLLCSSCSKNGGQASDTSESSSGPNISPTAAPGVAFNYRYQFNLPDERISATQEAHASQCEQLGISRCRITGMSYSIDQDEQVTAELDLKLDPSIARQFGKAAQKFVEGNDGKLVRLEIGSSDEGTAIAQATNRKTDVSAQIAQLQQELARTKAGSDAHANLLSQIQSLQQQASEQTQSIATSQAALASTPMTFHYYGRGGVPGFRGNPVREAWQTFITTVVWLVKILLDALAVLVPLGLVLAAFVALWRTRPMRLFREWFTGSQESDG